MVFDRSTLLSVILVCPIAFAGCGSAPSQSRRDVPIARAQPPLVQYGNRSVDLESYVTSLAFRGMVDRATEDVYWVKSTVDGETLLHWSGANQGQGNARSSPVLDFGKRAFSTPFYHGLTRSFYFISDTRNAEDYNLYHFDPQKPAVTKLTSHGVVRSVSALPAQDELFMIYRDGPSGSPVCVGAISAREPRHERAIYCDGGHQAEFTVNEFFPALISSDGLKAALVLNRNNNRADTHLGILDLSRGQLTVAVTHPKDDKRNQTFPFAWLGEKLYFLEQNRERETLSYLDVTSGEVFELDRLPGQAPEGSRNAVYEAKSGYFVYQEFGGRESALRIFDPVKRELLARLPVTDRVIKPGPFMTTEKGKVLFNVGNKTQPGHPLYALVPSDGAAAKLTAFFDSSAETKFEKPCPTETVYYPTFDQRPDGSQRLIEGILFLPAGGQKPTAALIYAHGGPTSRSTAAWALESQMFCHLGYAVFAPNPRGSSGFGKEFEDLNNFDWGGGDHKDYEYGRRYVAQRFGLSKDRIGIYGESYGGYMTNFALTRPDGDFGFGISMMGIADLTTTVRDSVVGQFLRGEIGDPETHAAFYKERSPIFAAENLRVPLLIVHGGSDNRVPTKESRMLFAKLSELGKDVKYVELEDEGHGFKYLSTIKIYMQSVLDFLHRVAPVE